MRGFGLPSMESPASSGVDLGDTWSIRMLAIIVAKGGSDPHLKLTKVLVGNGCFDLVMSSKNSKLG